VHGGRFLHAFDGATATGRRSSCAWRTARSSARPSRPRGISGAASMRLPGQAWIRGQAWRP